MKTREKAPAKEQILAVARILSEAGVEFTWNGQFSITPEQAALATSDPDAVTAACLGMTKAEIAAHDAHDWRCRATTKRGARCSNDVAAMGREKCGAEPVRIDADDPRFFYCATHAGGVRNTR